MNASVIVLEEVELDQHQVADVLTCLVETIAFNRALGAMRPAYDTMKTLEVDYPVCGIRGIEEQVRTLADTQLEDKMETIGPNLKRGRVSVEFYITAKAPSKFLGMHKSHILWEKWILTLLVTTGVVGEEDSEMSRQIRERKNEVLEKVMRQQMQIIVQECMRRADCTAPFSCTPGTPIIPYHVKIVCMDLPGAKDGSSWLGKFLQFPPSPF